MQGALLRAIALEKGRALCDYGRMKPEAFGLQAAGAGGDLPAEWQALIATQASTLIALLSRMQTAAATMRQCEAPAARWQSRLGIGRRGIVGSGSF